MYFLKRVSFAVKDALRVTHANRQIQPAVGYVLAHACNAATAGRIFTHPGQGGGSRGTYCRFGCNSGMTGKR